MSRIGPTGRMSLMAAVSVWAGVVAGSWWGLAGATGALAVALAAFVLAGRRPPVGMIGLALVAGTMSGVVAAGAVAAVAGADLPAGRVEVVARAATDPVPGPHGWRQVLVPRRLVTDAGAARWSGPPLALAGPEPLDAPQGSTVRLRGELVSAPGMVRGKAIAGRVRSPSVIEVRHPAGPVRGTAELVRGRILRSLEGRGDGGSLLAGFLIGDTTGVAAPDLEALRRAGLSHFVAVSGSNVALFLAAWWVLLAPLSRFPRWRAASGLVGLVLFAVITRAEASVVRASAMLAVLLVGKVVGWGFDRWTALGMGVAACLLVSGGLGFDVGFQLSVAATAGVMAGGDMVPFGPRGFRTVLGASLAAQLAVAPVVLTVFGTLPLLSPLANLAAAPLVAFATAVGGIGCLAGVDALVDVAVLASSGVIEVARIVAPWPQVDALRVLLVLIPVVLAVRLPMLRLPMTAVAITAVALIMFPPGARVDPPAVVFLDVGQGDAALVLGRGFTMVIDGGPDPTHLADRLRHYGVSGIDLLVASHVHADHLEGFRAVVGRVPIGRAWTAFEGQETPSSVWLSRALAEHGIPTRSPPLGGRFAAGDIAIEVVGPLRRYASPNDQSIVLQVELAGRSVLFPGDAEVVAQRELGDRPVDVLKVPHQGAATSDPGWLAATRPSLAVVSVGPNEYGHPAEGVLETLEGAGATVLRTDEQGDIVLAPEGVSVTAPGNRRRPRRTGVPSFWVRGALRTRLGRGGRSSRPVVEPPYPHHPFTKPPRVSKCDRAFADPVW